MEEALHIGHAIVVSIGMLANVLLIVACLSNTPKAFKTYSIILLNGAIIDLLANITDLIVIQRVIPVWPVLAFISYGACGWVSERFCYVSYAFWLHTMAHSLFILCLSFWYRYIILVREPPSRKRLIAIILVLYAPSFVLMTAFLFVQGRREVILEQLQRFYPTIQSSEIITDNESFLTLPVTLFTVYIAVTPFPAYVLILILRSKVLRRLSALADRMSAKTQVTHQQLMKALTLHAMLPLTFVIGASLFFVMFFNISHHPIFGHTSLMIASLPPAMNPFITIYFVAPYKRVLLGWMLRRVQRRQPPSILTTPAITPCTQPPVEGAEKKANDAEELAQF